jgi:Tfp pilus assembly protein PilN
MTPLFAFLEASTLRSVRFTDLGYNTSGETIELEMKGQARGYAALALQADAISNSQYFTDPIFSDLTLDDRGNVAFTFKAKVDPALVSFRQGVEKAETPVAPPITPTTTGTSSATTTSP